MQESDLVELCIVSSVSENGQISVFELQKPDHSLFSLPNTTHKGYPNHASLCFLPHHLSIIGSAFLDKSSIHIIDLKKKKITYMCSQTDKITSLITSHDEKYCFGGSEKGVVFVWQLPTGELIKMFDAHSYGAVSCMAMTADNNLLITGGKDSIVHVWNVLDVLDYRSENERDIEPLYTFSNHSLPITSVYCTQVSNPKLVTTSLDGTCILWDLSSGMEICSFKFFSGIQCAMLSPTEHSLFVGSTNGKIYETNLYAHAPEYQETSSLRSSANKSDVSTSFFAKVNVSTGIGNIKTFSIEDYSSNSEKTASNSSQSHVSFIYRAHTNAITELSISRDGTVLVSSSKDGSVRLWDIVSKQPIYTYKKQASASEYEFSSAKVVSISRKQFSSFSDKELVSRQEAIAAGSLSIPLQSLKKYVKKEENPTVAVVNSVPYYQQTGSILPKLPFHSLDCLFANMLTEYSAVDHKMMKQVSTAENDEDSDDANDSSMDEEVEKKEKKKRKK